MAYVVVVFCMLNVLALGAVGWYLREWLRDLPAYVQTVIQDEVRKQDDRIEKRLARATDKPETDPDAIGTLMTDGLKVGQPFRR